MSYPPTLAPDALLALAQRGLASLRAHLAAEPHPLAARLALALHAALPLLEAHGASHFLSQCVGRVPRDALSSDWLDDARSLCGPLRLCEPTMGLGRSPKRWSVERHLAMVHGLAVLDDGDGLVSAGEDSRLLLWRRGSDAEGTLLEGHEGPVNSLARTPDGGLVVTGGDDRTVRLWDTRRWTHRTLTGHSARVRAVACTDDVALSGAHDGLALVWDLARGKKLRALEHDGRDVMAVCLSPDGSLAATVTVDSALFVWDVRTGKRLAKLYGSEAPALVSLPGLYLGGARASGEGHERYPRALGFSADNAWLWSLGDELIVWDLAAGAEHARHRAHHQGFRAAALGDDGVLAAVGWGVHLWRVREGERWLRPDELEELAMLEPAIEFTCATLAPGGRALLVGERSGAVTEWALPVEPGAQQGVVHDGRVHALETRAQGKVLVSLSDEGGLAVWDAATGERLTRTLSGHLGTGEGYDVSPDGRWLLTTTAQEVALFDLREGRRVLERVAPQVHDFQRILSVKLLPGERRALVGSISLGVYDMDLGDAGEHHLLQGFTSQTGGIALSPDARHAALLSYFAPDEDGESGKDKVPVVQVYDLETRERLWRLFAQRPEGEPWSLALQLPAVLPDGSGLVGLSGQRHGEFVHWRWDGSIARSLQTDWAWILEVRPLPDGTLLVRTGQHATGVSVLAWLDPRRDEWLVRTLEFPDHNNLLVAPGETHALQILFSELLLLRLEPITELARLHFDAQLTSCAFDPSGRYALLGSVDGRVHRVELCL